MVPTTHRPDCLRINRTCNARRSTGHRPVCNVVAQVYYRTTAPEYGDERAAIVVHDTNSNLQPQFTHSGLIQSGHAPGGMAALPGFEPMY